MAQRAEASSDGDLQPPASFAYDGNLEKLKQYIQSHGVRGANSWGKNDQMSLLGFAVMSDNPEVVQFLLDKKADANKSDLSRGHGYTPLIIAAVYGKVESARVLIQNICKCGLKISTTDIGRRWNALMHCCDNENKCKAADIAIARLLIVAGIELNHQDKYGSTALHIAITCKAVEIARMIIDSGRCHLTQQDSRSDTPLILASKAGLTNVTELLLANLDKATIDAENLDGDTAFTAAAKSGSAKQLQLLFEAGANVFHRNLKNLDALMLARLRKKPDLIRFVEKLYRSANRAPPSRGSAMCNTSDPAIVDELHQLIEQNRSTQLLKRLGSLFNVDALGEQHQSSLLMAAAKYNRVIIIENLVQADATVDLCDSSGQTALHYAVQAGSSDAVLKLLHSGANPNCAELDRGLTPLMLCCLEVHSKEIAAYLLKYKANARIQCMEMDANTAFHLAVSSSNRAALRQLLKDDCDGCLSVTNAHGQTPLMLAVQHKHIGVVKLLVIHSRDATAEHLEAVDANGDTAFNLAAQTGCMEIVELLVRAGAKPNHANSSGKQAITIAEEAGHNHVRDYIKKLLRAPTRYPAVIQGSQNRGTVLWISVGSDDARRMAINYDENSLLKLFQTDMGYKFRQLRNLTAKELQVEMQKIGSEDHHSSASFLCFVSAHGWSDEETKKDYIAGMDPKNAATVSAGKKLISVENLTEPIANCASLREKPKIFFFQTCRCLHNGLRDRAVTTPSWGARLPNQRGYADLLEVYATSRGDAAYKHSKGTVFLQKLCKFINDNKDKHHLLHILTKLKYHLNETPIFERRDGTKIYQTVEIRGNLPKKMYFHDDELP